MIFEIIGTSKGIYSAAFVITRANAQIGQIYVAGKAGQGIITSDISFLNHKIEMGYGNRNLAPGTNVRYPCDIMLDQRPAGNAYWATYKESFLKSHSYSEMQFFGQVYTLYSLAFGAEGYKRPIYAGKRQIAEVRDPAEVYDSLYRYKVYAEDENAALVSVLLITHIYIKAYFHAGEQVIKGVEKSMGKTLSKFLLEKHNPDFIRYIQE